MVLVGSLRICCAGFFGCLKYSEMNLATIDAYLGYKAPYLCVLVDPLKSALVIFLYAHVLHILGASRLPQVFPLVIFFVAVLVIDVAIWSAPCLVKLCQPVSTVEFALDADDDVAMGFMASYRSNYHLTI